MNWLFTDRVVRGVQLSRRISVFLLLPASIGLFIMAFLQDRLDLAIMACMLQILHDTSRLEDKYKELHETLLALYRRLPR